MAFQTVFGENTKFDEDTGKFTFDKDSSALLLKTMELEQAVNGFAAGSNLSHTPVNSSGEKATEEQKTILKNITHACTQTKVFRDYDFSTIYERFSFTRGFVECKFNFEDISSHDANKIIICSWGIMSQLLRLDVEKV